MFSVHVRRHAIASDWVKLDPIYPISDSLNMHSDGLLDSHSSFPIRTTTKLPDLHRIGLAAHTQQHTVPPIKYEDLEHIVGPGFEEELERYYDQHKHDLEESTRRTPKPTSRPYKIYDPNDDPWSIYDKPMSMQTTSHPNSSTNPGSGDRFSIFDVDGDSLSGKPTVVTFITKPSHTHKQDTKLTSNTFNVIPQQFDKTTTPNPINASSSGKKRLRPKLFKLVQVPIVESSKKTSLFGFSSILQFFRKIQNSFVTNSSRSIQDKIKMLESFRDDLMENISKFRSLG